jgi:hypothetical protein
LRRESIPEKLNAAAERKKTKNIRSLFENDRMTSSIFSPATRSLVAGSCVVWGGMEVEGAIDAQRKHS